MSQTNSKPPTLPPSISVASSTATTPAQTAAVPPVVPPTGRRNVVDPSLDTLPIATRRRGATTTGAIPHSRLLGSLGASGPLSPSSPSRGGADDSNGDVPDDGSSSPRRSRAFRRRTASMPEARAIFDETTSGGGAALRALALLRSMRTKAEAAGGEISVSSVELTSLLRLVETAAAVVADSRSVEMVMKYKFLTLPDVYAPELQRFLLTIFTPSKQPHHSPLPRAGGGRAGAGAGAGASASTSSAGVASGGVGAASPEPSGLAERSSPSFNPSVLRRNSRTSPALGTSLPASGSVPPAATTGDASEPGSEVAASLGVEAGEVMSPGVLALRQGVEKQLSEVLDTINSWSFDVRQVEKLCPGETLTVVGHRLFQERNLIETFSLSEDILVSYLRGIESEYLNNSYHNASHGADVGVALNYILSTGTMLSWMSPEQVFASIVAALAHDVGHWAVNNAFLVSTAHPLALQYNDMSPLENMHIAKAFEVARRDGHNVFHSLDPATYSAVRKHIIQMVLATDNEFHFEYLGKLAQSLNVGAGAGSAGDEAAKKNQQKLTSTPKGQLLVLQISLHAADVNNAAKPWLLYLDWTERLLKEFYAQGDQERDLGMPVTPMLDRTKSVPLPKFQAGFINAIVLPLFHELNRVDSVDITEPVTQLESNLAEWNRQIAEMSKPSPPSPPPTSMSAPPTPATTDTSRLSVAHKAPPSTPSV